MMVEMEVFDFDMDKAALIGPAPLAARFAADMRTTHNNFGLVVDLSHFPTTYETSRFVIRTLRCKHARCARIFRISTSAMRSSSPAATATATSIRASAIRTAPTTSLKCSTSCAF